MNPLVLLEVFPEIKERSRLRWIKEVHGEEIEKLKEELRKLAEKHYPGLWEELKPFQRDDIAISIFQGPPIRLILGHEMGMGKTLMAALTAALEIIRRKLPGNVLVVAPATSGQFLNFANELEKWGFETVRLEGPLQLLEYAEREEERFPPRPRFFIISESRAKLTPGIRPIGTSDLQERTAQRMRQLYAAALYLKGKAAKPSAPQWVLDMARRMLSRRSNDPDFLTRLYLIISDRTKDLYSPKCPVCGKKVKLSGKRPKCSNCGEPLWSAYWGHKVPRWPIHKIAKKMRGFFSFLIVDEAHEEKKEDSSRGTVVSALSAQTENVEYLTGTPFQGKASQLFYLMGRLFCWAPERFPFRHNDIKKFVEKFGILEAIIVEEEKEESYYGWRGERKKKISEAPGIANKALWIFLNRLMIRRKKSIELAGELQGMEENSIKIPFSQEHLSLYKTATKEAERERAGRNFAAAYWTLIRAANLPSGLKEKLRGWPVTNKDKTLLNLLYRLVHKEKRKVIVFTGLTDRIPVINKLKDIIEEAGFLTEIWPAKIPFAEKIRRTSEFQRNLSQVAVASLAGYNVGLNLPGASAAIFYEPYPRAEFYEQAKSRIWRIGQSRDTLIYLLFMEGSVEEATWNLLTVKLDTMARFIDGELPPTSLVEVIEQMNKEIIKEAVERSLQDLLQLANLQTREIQIEQPQEQPIKVQKIPAGYQPALF